MTPNKYIIVRNAGLETAILLHGSVSHFEAVNADVLRDQGGELLSAGYWTIADGRVVVAKDTPSTTLNIAPRENDAEIIERTLYLLRLPLSPAAKTKIESVSTH